MLIAGKIILYIVNNNFKQAVDKQNLPKAKMENKKCCSIPNQNNRCLGIFSQHAQPHGIMAVIKQLPHFNFINNLLSHLSFNQSLPVINGYT